jgi:hypothetical protein
VQPALPRLLGGGVRKTDSLSLDLLTGSSRRARAGDLHVPLLRGGTPDAEGGPPDPARRHDDCAFLAFTNATLVDAPFAAELKAGEPGPGHQRGGRRETTDAAGEPEHYRKALGPWTSFETKGSSSGSPPAPHRDNGAGARRLRGLHGPQGVPVRLVFTYIPIGAAPRRSF